MTTKDVEPFSSFRQTSTSSSPSDGTALRRLDPLLFDSVTGEWQQWSPSRQVSQLSSSEFFSESELHSGPPLPGTPELRRARGDLLRFYALLAVMGILACLLAFLSGVASGLGSRFRGYLLATTFNFGNSAFGSIWLADLACFLAWVAFEVLLVLLAHRVSRQEPMTYGSAVPEIRCALQGTDLKNYYSMKLLWVRATSLMLSETSGLPVGKEGPFVHMSAIIGNRLLRTRFFQSVVRIPSFWQQILAASVAIGSCSAFGVPIGGVLFALEVMPDTCWRNSTYWSCLWACAFGSFALRMLNAVFSIDITWPVRIKMNSPIVSLLPHQAGHTASADAAGNFDRLYMTFACGFFGLVCGCLGSLYIKTQIAVSGIIRPWLAGQPESLSNTQSQRWHDTANQVRGVLEEPLMERSVYNNFGFRAFDLNGSPVRIPSMAAFRWSPSRGSLLCAAVAACDAILNFCLPLLRRNSQPSLLWEITSHPRVFMTSADPVGGSIVLPHDALASALPHLPVALFLVCSKWILVSFVLNLPLPSGCIIPLYALGALIGRLALLLLELFGFTVLLQFDGELILVFATAFTASICRSVSVCLAVFEIVAIPNLMLPLSFAGVVAVYVSNALTPSIFEAISRERRLPAVPQPRTLLDGVAPVTAVMRMSFPIVPQTVYSEASVDFLRSQLERYKEEKEFVVLQGDVEEVQSVGQMIPMGYVYRRAIEEICNAKIVEERLGAFKGTDLLSAPQVPSTMSVKNVVDVMELYMATCVFVCDGGYMVGILNYADVLVQVNRGKLPSAANLLMHF